MVSEAIMDTIKRILSSHVLDSNLLNDNEVYICVSPSTVKEDCINIYKNIECVLVDLFANDTTPIDNKLTVYYTFAVRSSNTLIILYLKLETGNTLMIDSIAPEVPAAGLYEREIHDMYGIKFKGIPDSRELVHHGNFPLDVHPLRKDFKAKTHLPFEKRELEFASITGTGVFEVPVGPVHAGIIEPGHFRFSVAGEPIINLEAKLYYVHRGLEKLCENQDFMKVLLFSERISGDETYSNSLAYCQAIEKINGITYISERAAFSRVIFSELERICGHIGDISGLCVDTAYIFPSGQFAMMRRWIQLLNEQLTGSRFLRNTNKPGGLRRDFIRNNEKIILECINKLDKEFRETVAIIKNNGMFIDRVEHTGILKNSIAVDLNAVGPGGRASGIKTDVRKEFPYAAYSKVKFSVPEHGNCDVNCRMNVKIEEVIESISIIRQALEKMPEEGPIAVKVGNLKPYAFAFGMTEAPRGENIHFVMTGENNTIFRYKVRTPSFCNWPVLCHAVKTNTLTDFPLINKSFNLSYAGNDL
ncbi:MAG TPA: NADH-quinone oxidoreductase subunit C [Ruminiclostridium sp.]|nr:NADH-quinone oxidoreductase subunit C [Ruminiclostridium sp.]